MNDAQPDTNTNANTGTGPDAGSTAGTDGAAKDVPVAPGPPPSEPIDDGSQAVARIGGVVAAVAVVLALLRLIRVRRQEPTPQDRLTEATHALGTAAVGLGGRAAQQAATAAATAAAVAAPAARDAAARAVGTAQGAATFAFGTAHDAAELAGEGVRRVGAVAAEGVREVAEGVESVQKAWHKLVTRLIVVVFGSAGYVLGARAGRERYEQIVSGARRAQDTIRST